ncbi:hypothetical protein BS78_07G154600 [Paspalum vaginatum]|nr:hypothetical protein BS78_07G154600 [Paspalum vaginatum]
MSRRLPSAPLRRSSRLAALASRHAPSAGADGTVAGAEVVQDHHPCSICMEPMAPSSVYRGGASCAHAFCGACLSGHVRAKLERGAVVRCPDASCTAALDPELCRGVLPSQVFERWCAVLCESMFLGARRTYCPFPDCSEMMVADDGEDRVTQSECHGCRRLFCAQCGVAWHAGVTCEEFARLGVGERAREDLLLVEAARKGNWKRCPRCRFYVEKSTGCMHITCRCGFQFCYRCGKPWAPIHDCCRPEA